MTRRILIVGAGFAGLWSALGAARVLDGSSRADGSIEVAMIAPAPELHLRPRLHEAAPGGMRAPLRELFEATGIRFVQGRVERIDADAHTVDAVDRDGRRFSLGYDRLVLAAGSELHRPDIPGLHARAFSIDQVDDASALERHLADLANLPDGPARNTVIVVGGGFTGIEIACELPSRLRAVLGDAAIKVILIERADAIGPDLGAGPRPVIEEALDSLGILRRTNTAVAAIDSHGVRTSTDECIEARTVIWTAGLKANALTQQIAAPRDPLGRLQVEQDLRVAAVENVFATGDVAFAAVDDAGHHALMSCQHAMTMGRFAGYNVAADLLGLPTIPYSQPRYVTCLDLGGWGAVYTEGWARQVKLSGAQAKALKRTINTQWIYPPPPDRAQALALADPNRGVVA